MTPELTIGVDPVRVKVDVPNWERLKRIFRRADPISCLRIVHANTRVTVLREDEGSVDVAVWLINFSKKTVFSEGVSVTHWSWLGRILPSLHVVPRGLGQPLAPRSMGILSFETQLNTAAIRRILEAGPIEVVHAVGAHWNLNISGQISFRNQGRPLAMQLQIQNPQVQFYWYHERAKPAGP